MEQAFKEGAKKAEDEAYLAQLIRSCERDLQERALKEESDSDEDMDSDTDSSDTMDQAPSDYGWDEEDTEVEPLPQSIYSGTPPPKAPAPPPVRFPGFNWSEPETDYDTDYEEEACDLALSDEQARRSSPFEGGEHTVMEPPFLTHEWEDNHFPQT